MQGRQSSVTSMRQCARRCSAEVQAEPPWVLLAMWCLWTLHREMASCLQGLLLGSHEVHHAMRTACGPDQGLLVLDHTPTPPGISVSTCFARAMASFGNSLPTSGCSRSEGHDTSACTCTQLSVAPGDHEAMRFWDM